MALANIVASMNISKDKCEDGQDITPAPEFTTGFATFVHIQRGQATDGS